MTSDRPAPGQVLLAEDNPVNQRVARPCSRISASTSTSWRTEPEAVRAATLTALSSHPHGLSAPGPGRVPGDQRDPAPAGRLPSHARSSRSPRSDTKSDRATLPGRRHGRLPDQAAQPEGARRGVGPLGPDRIEAVRHRPRRSPPPRSAGPRAADPSRPVLDPRSSSAWSALGRRRARTSWDSWWCCSSPTPTPASSRSARRSPRTTPPRWSFRPTPCAGPAPTSARPSWRGCAPPWRRSAMAGDLAAAPVRWSTRSKPSSGGFAPRSSQWTPAS